MNEYTIAANGVTLNGGRTWQDADHLNVRTESGTTNFHAEAKCAALPAPPECSPIMQAAASRIGESFIPWSDLAIDPASCISWVQFSRANYHYGESGEDPLCLTVVDEEPPVEESPVDTPPILEPPFECPPGKAPGWLDENGMPQGCVDDNPTPGKPKDEIPPVDEIPTPETPGEPVVVVPTDTPAPEMLAETGSFDLAGIALVGVVLLAAGVAALRKSVKR